MEKRTEETLKALMAQHGLEPREGDLERFGKLLDTYVAALEALHSAGLTEEEIAPTFDPRWKTE
jgi:hypothetical protein